MFWKLGKILERVDADYADIRYEVKRETSILFNGKDLISIASSFTDGYVLRILRSGGFSSISFTRDSDGEKAIRAAQENAQILSRKIEKPVQLARSDAVKDRFAPQLNEDPRDISIDEKIEFEQRRVDAYRQRLIQQFARLEAVLAELNDQANYLAGQLENLGINSSQS